MRIYIGIYLIIKLMYKSFFKRILDFSLSIVALPFVFLVCILVWVAIKCDDGGPLFHYAERIGKNGKIFKMFKFRSMIVNAPDIRLEDGSTYNASDDPRVTKVGRFLRKTSVDEVPQLINIIKGDMALIGPRPDSAFYLSHYTEEERVILTVRPGLTGWNQVINRNSVGTKEKLQADIYYVNHLSFFFDVKILWLTFKSVLARKGIYRS